MAVTQQRIISIINAGLDYRQALQAAIKIMRGQAAAVRQGSTTLDEAFNTALSAVSEDQLLDNSNSAAILVSEARHFQSNFRRNQRLAEKAEAKRRARGIVARPTAGGPFLDTEIYSNAARQKRETNELLARAGLRMKPNTQIDTNPSIDLSYDPDDPENAGFRVTEKDMALLDNLCEECGGYKGHSEACSKSKEKAND